MATSWPVPPPPYAGRRSRSRSPYRGGHPPRPPYPEGTYGDAYRADWDAYDRDRAWASYERDRAAFDYGRRGRSRSPGMDENGRKRRRSLSPYDNRYDPRPRYDDYDHGRYGRSPPRGSYGGRSAPPDPHTFDFPASLKQFAEWFRYFYPQQAAEEDLADKAAEQEAGDGTKPRNGIRMKWEAYKKDFAAMQLSRMFDHHRKSPWFAEKYNPDPEYANLRARTRQRGWKGRLPAFLTSLEDGLFDPSPEPTADPDSPTKEDPPANGDGDVKPNTEGEEQFDEDANGEANSKGVTGSGADDGTDKRANRGDEITVPNEGQQVMIRTIPPDIGRAKLESALAPLSGYVYTALGDPLQKRNFYRAGWIKFADDTDMESVMTQIADKKIEGFKLHVTHLVKPFSNRIRYAPEVSSRPERLVTDLANAKALAALLEKEYDTYRSTTYPPLGAAQPKSDALESTNGDAKPEPEPEVDEKMEEQAEEEPAPVEPPAEAIARRLEHLLAEAREAGTADPNDERAWSMKKTALELDLYLAYLRAAFHTCYYCAVVTDHLEELQRKCIAHVRKPLTRRMLEEIKAAEDAAAKEDGPDGPDVKEEDTGEKPVAEKPTDKGTSTKEREGRDWKRNDERWLEWLDSKIALLINRDGVNPKDYGGKSYEEELSKAVEPHVKQEDEGKFRCKTCQKLFKATSFVEKHIVNKHPELIKSLEDLPYFNNFALDPHRIQPLTHPPNTVPTGQAPPPQAYGMHASAAYAPDYARGGYHGGSGGAMGYPPAYPYGAYPMDPYAYPYGGAGGGYGGGRDPRGRLGDRIGGYVAYDGPADVGAGLPLGAGLPAKPIATLEPGPGARRGGRGAGGPPPPPPPDAKEDPRAAAGRRVSYHDMDLVAEGDVELQY